MIISDNDSSYIVELLMYHKCLRKLLFTENDEQRTEGRLSTQLSGAMSTGSTLAPSCLFLRFHLPDARTGMTSRVLNKKWRKVDHNDTIPASRQTSSYNRRRQAVGRVITSLLYLNPGENELNILSHPTCRVLYS